VAVYRQDGRQRKEFAATFREAREIKIRRTAEEAGRRAGPTVHSYALDWVDHYAGRGANDVINDRTRREYRRLLITYALAYFEPDERLRDIDEHRARGFVDWLCHLTDDDGHRLCDRSVRNAALPLQSCLRHAARAGLLGDGSEPRILLPQRRRGRAYEFDERRFLTREQLARLLAEIPDDLAAVVRAARIDWPANLRGDRTADHGRRPRHGRPESPCPPRDRKRPAHWSEVPARQAHDPDQS
jgi:hypothetical protein